MRVFELTRRGEPARQRRAAVFVVALALLAGACSSSPPAFDLTAPRQVRTSGVSGTLIVVEPTALQQLESERILVKDAAGSLSVLGGGQWADRLPRLVQARLLQTFENASKIRAVARPGDGIVADYQLNSELRAFQLDAGRGDAVVEISAKLIALNGGRVISARIFGARVPVGSTNVGEVAQALDRALSNVLVDIVRWGGRGG